MGRWKAGAGGQAVWDATDSGPNQVAPPAGFDPATGQPIAGSQPTQPQQPSDGSGITGGMDMSGFARAGGSMAGSFGRAQQGGALATGNVQTGQPTGQPQTGSIVGQPGGPEYNPNQPNRVDHNWVMNQVRSAGGGTQGLQASLAQIRQAYPNATIGGANGDKLMINGIPFDVIRGAAAGGTAVQWLDPTHPGGGGVAAGAGGAGATGGTIGGAGAAGGLAPNTLRDQLLEALMGRSKQTLAIDRTDPTLRAQSEPFAAAQERARRDYLADIAEQAGPNANLRGEQRLAAERKGQAVGQFESELIGKEIGARRTEIQNALSQMGSMLSDEQKLALQRELGLLDDATRRLGIQSQERTGMAGVGAQMQAALLANELGRSRLDFDITRSLADEEAGYGDLG